MQEEEARHESKSLKEDRPAQAPHFIKPLRVRDFAVTPVERDEATIELGGPKNEARFTNKEMPFDRKVTSSFNLGQTSPAVSVRDDRTDDLKGGSNKDRSKRSLKIYEVNSADESVGTVLCDSHNYLKIKTQDSLKQTPADLPTNNYKNKPKVFSNV